MKLPPSPGFRPERLPLWLLLLALSTLFLCSVDKGYFYRPGNTNWNSSKDLAIAENLSPDHCRPSGPCSCGPDWNRTPTHPSTVRGGCPSGRTPRLGSRDLAGRVTCASLTPGPVSSILGTDLRSRLIGKPPDSGSGDCRFESYHLSFPVPSSSGQDAGLSRR